MLDGIEGAIGNTLVAGFAAARQTQDARRIQGARNAAAISRATAAVAAQTADELRRDLVLQQFENRDLVEQLDDLRDDLRAEQARTELLTALLIDAKDATLSPEARKAAITAALAAVRAHRAA